MHVFVTEFMELAIRRVVEPWKELARMADDTRDEMRRAYFEPKTSRRRRRRLRGKAKGEPHVAAG